MVPRELSYIVYLITFEVVKAAPFADLPTSQNSSRSCDYRDLDHKMLNYPFNVKTLSAAGLTLVWRGRDGKVVGGSAASGTDTPA